MTKDSLFSPEELVEELKQDSKSLGLPEHSTSAIIKRVLESVLIWLENRDIITKSDLERVVSCELDKYSSDLAFLYRNRNKII
ncbi:hypothetical protein IKF81_01530 [Candidatus Saccharibacteria bacterium]|nr:hypothetical protein [Candidatus Saccharibacteria bacterium]